MIDELEKQVNELGWFSMYIENYLTLNKNEKKILII